MDVREKLVELLTEFYGSDPMYYGVDASAIAQHLIDNGVTVQEWISVDDRFPEDGVRVLAAHDDGDIIEISTVRHGRWECQKPCPVCGENRFKGLDADIWADWTPPYCPNCGAKMDKGSE